jgi:hypothetical protein
LCLESKSLLTPNYLDTYLYSRKPKLVGLVEAMGIAKTAKAVLSQQGSGVECDRAT